MDERYINEKLHIIHKHQKEGGKKEQQKQEGMYMKQKDEVLHKKNFMPNINKVLKEGENGKYNQEYYRKLLQGIANKE